MRKTISILLVFYVFLLSGLIFAEENRGAIIEVYEKKPQMEGAPWEMAAIRGELIAVKKNSLLILESDSGSDVSVQINDVYEVKILKKSKKLAGGIIGFLTGVGIGIAASLIGWEKWSWAPKDTKTKYRIVIAGGVSGGVIAAVAGGMIGAHKSRPETYRIAGKTHKEVTRILVRLRAKASVSNYK